MLDDPVDDVRQGLEATVRVPRGALRLAWCVLDLAHLVHVDERVQFTQVHSREGPAYREALPLEPARGGRHRTDRPLGHRGRIGYVDAGQDGHVVDSHGRHMLASSWQTVKK